MYWFIALILAMATTVCGVVICGDNPILGLLMVLGGGTALLVCLNYALHAVEAKEKAQMQSALDWWRED